MAEHNPLQYFRNPTLARVGVILGIAATGTGVVAAADAKILSSEPSVSSLPLPKVTSPATEAPGPNNINIGFAKTPNTRYIVDVLSKSKDVSLQPILGTAPVSHATVPSAIMEWQTTNPSVSIGELISPQARKGTREQTEIEIQAIRTNGSTTDTRTTYDMETTTVTLPSRHKLPSAKSLGTRLLTWMAANAGRSKQDFSSRFLNLSTASLDSKKAVLNGICNPALPYKPSVRQVTDNFPNDSETTVACYAPGGAGTKPGRAVFKNVLAYIVDPNIKLQADGASIAQAKGIPAYSFGKTTRESINVKKGTAQIYYAPSLLAKVPSVRNVIGKQLVSISLPSGRAVWSKPR